MLAARSVRLGVGAGQSASDLIVFSHLRWTWVWQRPQQLVSRLASRFDRTFFVEEPEMMPDAAEPTLRTQLSGGVMRVWLEVQGPSGHCGFQDPRAATYGELLLDLLGGASGNTSWLYTPLALPLAEAVSPARVVFDVMDDLASFLGADPALPDLHVQALSRADVVFTGGRSLQSNVRPHRPDAMCCPSGVDLEHYSRAVDLCDRTTRRPVAGYVGVVDERIDLPLLRDLARLLPDWDIDVVGPVAKIDPRDLPVEPNLNYLGARSYHQLPDVMAGFDVALMPFALNAATRSISPTKTLEYLAANLPVVSTRVPDVVSEFCTVVDLESDAAGFADACRRLLGGPSIERRRLTEALLRWNQWDAIAERMSDRLTAPDALDDAQEAL